MKDNMINVIDEDIYNKAHLLEDDMAETHLLHFSLAKYSSYSTYTMVSILLSLKSELSLFEIQNGKVGTEWLLVVKTEV